MKKYKFLTLTDHSGHSQHNSLYALMAKLSGHPQSEEVYLASRGNVQNQPFFIELSTTKIHAHKIDKNFAFQEQGEQFTKNQKLVDIQDFDVIIMRLPRPISDEFLKYLKNITNSTQLFVNDPFGIIKTSTKQFLLNFPSVCPPMQLCKSKKAVLDFAKQFAIVLKPLKEYGGKGIVKINGNQVSDGNKTLVLEDYLNSIQTGLEEDGYLAMQFLKNVSKGDKRILVVNGEILATSLRLPAPDSWLCNVAQGGKSVPSTISPEEEDIIATITPRLLKEGIVVFGADTLVGDDGKRILSEVNTLSVGGFPQAEAQTGKPVVQQAINNIIAYLNNQS